jgi:hypothetical protein
MPVGSLLRVIEGERLEALYVLALATGLRRGELLGLRWDDIDMSSRQMHVRRAVQRVEGELRFVEPKTSSSARVIVVPRLAMGHLERHLERQDQEWRKLGAAWQEYGLVFASSVGTPLEPRNVNRRWDELRVRAGLDWLRLHDLRHECATQFGGWRAVADDHGRAWSLGNRGDDEHLCARGDAAPRGCRGRHRWGAGRVMRGTLAAGSAAVLAANWQLRVVELGALGGTRTPNLLIRSQMLYPLSYERRCDGQSTAQRARPAQS